MLGLERDNCVGGQPKIRKMPIVPSIVLGAHWPAANAANLCSLVYFEDGLACWNLRCFFFFSLLLHGCRFTACFLLRDLQVEVFEAWGRNDGCVGTFCVKIESFVVVTFLIERMTSPHPTVFIRVRLSSR
jgi:hypothetical protein